MAVGEEPRPQAQALNALDEHPQAFRHDRTTPARPARLWSALTVHGLAERSTILGQAVAFFVFKLRERQRPTRSAIGNCTSSGMCILVVVAAVEAAAAAAAAAAVAAAAGPKAAGLTGTPSAFSRGRFACAVASGVANI
jgi:hypothetical protein